jgi:hypothetical protein
VVTLALALIIVWLFVGAVVSFVAGLCRIDDPDMGTLIAFWPIALGVVLVAIPMFFVVIAGIWIYHAGLALSERLVGEAS